MKIERSGFVGRRDRGAVLTAVALALVWSGSTIPQLAYAQEATEASPQPVLTLKDALYQAAIADPALEGTQARIRAAQGGIRQANVRPNPTLGVNIDNVPTIGAGSWLNRAEATVSYQQTLERGGDREARTRLAMSEGDLVVAEARVAQMDRMEEVQRAWAETLAAEANVLIARQNYALAQQFEREVRRRVDAARDPLFAGARADSATALAQIELDQAEVAARLARITLAKFWNGRGDFQLPAGAFEDTSSANNVSGEVAEEDLIVFRSRQDIASAQVRVEQAKAVQDVTVSAGVRYTGENDLSLVVGASIPLQRYDRNQGAIDRALAQRNAAQADERALKTEREREIARLQVLLLSRASEARRIEEETLPQAERAVILVREGFARGGFTYNDVMSAQTALLELKARKVAILQSFHNDRARLDRLTGAHSDVLDQEARP